ncbi:YceG family protein [Gardnerella vaginalis]|uniref:Endolytic murein transglycosylase n=2 Tax=Gardnerella vaginalis TaxID=2702 RepID=A0A135Z1U7_GARVA|nr:YceG family protein [Gardnerella vaginalis]
MRRNKSRNSRKSRKQKRIKTIIVLLIVALIVCFAGYGLARAVRSMIGYQSLSASEDWPGPGEGSISFSVEVGESANSIGSRLEKEEIVKSKAVFTSIVSSNNKILYPGIYELKKHMSAIDVADILSNRKKATGFLEVKAGERSVDIIKRASEISGIDYSKFKAILQAKGAGILPQEASGSFEGWLEPGVYNVKAMKSAEKIMSAMVEKRIAKLNAIGVPKGDKRENILKIASIAEAEVNNREYYGKVSRVILNRIDKDMPLGMDTTIAYGAGVRAIDLTKSMLDNANNPYNTRIHKGLPPTPISIPGPNAIAAAMHPENGSWLYFVTTDLKTGETKFVNTHEEFLKIKDEYKRNNKDAN